jgi:NAD+ kinase
MKIGIFTNLSKDTGLKHTAGLIELLRKYRLEYCLSDALEERFAESSGGLIGGARSGAVKYFDNDALVKNSDVLAVLGGDGTVLSLVSAAAKGGKPILGVNAGRLGFLTEAERDNMESVVKALGDKKYYIENRVMLKAEVNNNEYYALNEVVLIRESYTSVIKIDAFNNGKKIETYLADGVMVATPTGSTAYSLSAGGAVLSPDVAAFMLIAISPHSLSSRPIVFSDGDVVTMRVSQQNRACVLVYDGIDIPFRLYSNDEVKISKSPYKAQFIRTAEHNFYERLMKKMSLWTQN